MFTSLDRQPAARNWQSVGVAPPASLIIVFEDERHTLNGDEPIEFGRSSDLTIDSANRQLHRRLGRFRFDGSSWWIDHLGTNSTLVLTDHRSASALRIAPGNAAPIPFAESSLTFSAGPANYRLTLTCDVGPIPDDAPAPLPVAEATITTLHLEFNDEQHELLELLARHHLSAPDDGRLPTNRELGATLGWSSSKFNRKLDHLCTKLTRAGVSGLQGSLDDVAVDRKRALARYAADRGMGIG